MPWNSQSLVFAEYVIVYGTSGGLFIYSGTPGPGNPPVAWAVASTVTKDLYGNSLPVSGGFVTYDKSSGATSQMFDALLTLIGGSGGQIISDANLQVTGLYSDSTPDVPSVTLAAVATEDQYSNVISPGVITGVPGAQRIQASTNGTLLQYDASDKLAMSFVTNPSRAFSLNDTSGNIQLQAQASLPGWVGPAVAWEPGATGTTAETWHAMGTLSNSWGDVAGYHAPAYRLTAQGDLQLTGRITVSDLTSGTFFTLPSGYYSTSYTLSAAISASSGTVLAADQTPRILITTGGACEVFGCTTGDAATVDIDATFALSAG